MKKKSTLIVALVICLVAIMTVGSLAYFTAQKSVQNKFMTAAAGSSGEGGEVTPDDLFSIKLFETTKGENDETVENTTGLTYKEIQPADVLAKDPTVRNTGKYEQYIRMHVTFSNVSAWQAALGEGKYIDSILNVDATKWDVVRGTAANDKVTYTYYLKTKLAPAEGETPAGTATLFTTVTIPATLTVDQMVGLAEFTIDISAEAIQTANTGDNAKAAFETCWGK